MQTDPAALAAGPYRTPHGLAGAGCRLRLAAAPDRPDRRGLTNGRAKAVRFSTLESLCRVLDCQPGDLLEWVDDREIAVSPSG